MKKSLRYRKKKFRIAVVASRFNEPVTQRLWEGARDALVRRGLSVSDIRTVWVPGSFEIPLAAQAIARKRAVDAIICLGAIIQGETMHHEMIAHEVTRGIARVGLETGVPVVMGVLTTRTWEQAMDRSGGKAGNRGAEAAVTAMDMCDILDRLNHEKKNPRP